MKLFYFFTWWWLQILCAVLFRWRVLNRENVPMHGPAIIASNHASFLDPPLLGGASKRELHFLGRDTLFKFPLVGWVLRQHNAVPVDRDGGGGAGLKAILDRLRAGCAIVLFPEGTRSSDGQLLPARSGIGLVVIKSNAPIIPVRIFGSHEALGRKHYFPRPKQITVRFGEPLDFATLRTEARHCSKDRLKQIYQEIADQIMAAIGRLQAYEVKSRFP